MKSSGSRLRLLVIPCVLTLISLHVWPLAAQDGGAPAPKVSIAAAYTQDVTPEVDFIGRGEAIDSTDIVARVDGFLEEIAVGEGVTVEKGDLLFRIEPDRYQATLFARQAELARARANLELADLELARKEDLVARDVVPAAERDIARADKLIAEAEVQVAEAAIQQAELDLSYTEVFAPFKGRIGRTGPSIGELVGPATPPLVALVREAPIYVTFSLSERQLVNVLQEAGTDMTGLIEDGVSPEILVVLPNGTVLDEIGRIVFIDNRIDPVTGTISLRAEFANERGLILDGAFLTVRIRASVPTQSVLIPLSAVQRDQRGDFVLIVTDQQLIEQRYVILGEQVETAVIVREGLREGESVVVEGLQRIRPGVQVDAVLAGQPQVE